MRIIGTLLLPVLLAGCGGAPPPLAPVKGKVFYQGRPLTTGTIVFTPDPVRGTSGPLAHGLIQPDGSYQLKAGDQAGTVPGWHRVTVLAMDVAPQWNSQQPVTPRSFIPHHYSDPSLSKLACEVQPGKENTLNFNLE